VIHFFKMRNVNINMLINLTRLKKIKSTLPNTDNKGKLFVTVFAFLPAGRQVLLLPRQILNGMYRDRARAPLQHPVPGLRLGHLATLYRDTRNAQQPLYPDGKNTCHTLLAP
jgi:hypothetical protein